MTAPEETVEELEQLIIRMRKASSAVYLATDEAVADDLSAMLIASAAALEAQRKKIVRLNSTLYQIVSAWTVPGPVPEFHYAEQSRVMSNWSTLGRAIQGATRLHLETPKEES